jgi:hypothetical protein
VAGSGWYFDEGRLEPGRAGARGAA